MARKTNVNAAPKSESDIRLQILNDVLKNPHGELTNTEKIHNPIAQNDPLFYGHLASWYFDKGEIRDHKIVFVGNLLTSNLEEHRDAGFMFLKQMAPFEVARVIKYILEVNSTWTRHGLPGCARTALKQLVREIESNDNRFDRAVVRGSKFMKYIYKNGKVKPSDRAQKILFEGDYPKGSLPYFVTVISNAKTPAEQAKLIVKHKIAYPIASTIIKKITPTVLVALIDSMSSQELITNMNSIKKHGAYDNEDVKKLIKEKLKVAKTDTKVSAMKTRKATAVADLSADIAKELDDVGDRQIQSKGEIKRPTALLIDKSGSMNVSIEVGRQIAALVSAICINGLYVYAFDSMPYEIVAKGHKLSDWEKATIHIGANGATSIGAPLKSMMSANRRVEQFIIVTDEDENATPRFKDIYPDYCNQFGVKPNVYIVHPNKRCSSHLQTALKGAGVTVDSFDFDGDYYSLVNLVPLLSAPSQLDLLIEIMNYPLPVRSDRTDRKVTV